MGIVFPRCRQKETAPELAKGTDVTWMVIPYLVGWDDQLQKGRTKGQMDLVDFVICLPIDLKVFQLGNSTYITYVACIPCATVLGCVAGAVSKFLENVFGTFSNGILLFH